MARKKTKKPAHDIPKKRLFDDLSPNARQAIWAVVTAIIAVFFLFSLFNYAGPVGEYTSIALRFLFGAGAWLAPITCALYIYVLLSPRKDDSQVSVSKVIGTILLFVSILGGLELYREDLGGLTGLAISWPLEYLIGKSLAAILIFGLILISIFLTFNTGLRFTPKEKKLDEFEEDDLSHLIPDAMSKNAESEDEEPVPDEEEEKESNFGKVTKKVADVVKGVPNEIVIKNFSGTYVPPPISLLNKEAGKAQIGDVKANANMIKRTLQEFGISVEMDAVESGPTITRYALKPAQGVRIAKIVGLQQELQLALRASSIRIEPIPGKSLVGVEVPNPVRATVRLSSMLSSPEYTDSPHPLMAALGKDVTGHVHFTNVARMPHGLIAGTTGSGKSVAIHNIIISLL